MRLASASARARDRILAAVRRQRLVELLDRALHVSQLIAGLGGTFLLPLAEALLGFRVDAVLRDLLRPFLQRRTERHLLAVALDQDLHRIANAVQSDLVAQIGHRGDRRAVELQHDVAGLDAHGLGGGVAEGVLDVDPLIRGQAFALLDAVRDRTHLDPEHGRSVGDGGLVVVAGIAGMRGARQRQRADQGQGGCTDQERVQTEHERLAEVWTKALAPQRKMTKRRAEPIRVYPTRHRLLSDFGAGCLTVGARCSRTAARARRPRIQRPRWGLGDRSRLVHRTLSEHS